MILPVLLPVLAGALLPALHLKKSSREIYVAAAVALNSILVFCLLLNRPDGALTLAAITAQVSIAFKIDGLSMVFAGLVAALWPLASIYAFEYMEHEGKQDSFFAFYTAAYGIVVGVAFSANLITMYLFY